VIIKRTVTIFIIVFVVYSVNASSDKPAGPISLSSPDSVYSSNELFAYARSVEMRGEKNKAYELYRKSYHLNPENFRSCYRAGRILNDYHEYELAREAYKRSIDIAGDFYPAHSSLGILLEKIGEDQQAINALRKAVRVAPDYAPAWRNLGKSLVKIGDEKSALFAYAKAVNLDVNDIPTRTTLGILLARQGKLDEAKRQLENVLSYDPKNIRAKKSLDWIKKYPGDLKNVTKDKEIKPEIKFTRKRVSPTKRKIETQKYNPVWVFNTPAPGMVNPEVLKKNGMDYLRLRKFKEASEVLAVAAQYDNNDPELFAAQAFALFRIEEFDKSALAYEKAIEISKRKKMEVPWYYLNRGLALYYSGNYKTATKVLKRALEFNPDFSRAHYILGLVRLERKQYRHAVRSLKKTVEIDPGFIDGQVALAVSYIRSGYAKSAIVHYREALSRRPDDPDLTIDLARLLEKEKFYSQSADEYERFLFLTEGNEVYSIWREMAKSRMKRYRKNENNILISQE